MTVRNYTLAERAALKGGLDRERFERVANTLEYAMYKLCRDQPVAAIGAAIHGLVCGNQALRDFLDTTDHVCAICTGRSRGIVDSVDEKPDERR